MLTFDHVPRWLGEDHHAAQLLRDGWHIDAAFAVCERAAIYRHDAGAGELEAEFSATVHDIHHAPKGKLK